MPSMRQFLQTGRLGEIQLGLRPEQVIGILGAPEDQTAKRRPLRLLRYGAVEFGFLLIPQTTDSRLVSTAIYFNDLDRVIPPSLRPTDWLPTNSTNELEFHQFLNEAGIEVHSSVHGQQEYIILVSGASIVF